MFMAVGDFSKPNMDLDAPESPLLSWNISPAWTMLWRSASFFPRSHTRIVRATLERLASY